MAMSHTLDDDAPQVNDSPSTPRQGSFRLAFVAMAFLVFFFLVMVSIGSTSPELTIALRNTGSAHMHNVVVRMPDVSSVMGFLAAGGERSVRTRATRNAPVMIEFIDSRGRYHSLRTEALLQPGEVGTVTIDVNTSRVLRVYKETRIDTTRT